MSGGVCVSAWWCGQLSPLNMSSLSKYQSISKTSLLSCPTHPPCPHYQPFSYVSSCLSASFHLSNFYFLISGPIFDGPLLRDIFLCQLSICHSFLLTVLFLYTPTTCQLPYNSKKGAFICRGDHILEHTATCVANKIDILCVLRCMKSRTLYMIRPFDVRCKLLKVM